jgi:hypothetical protein
MLDDNLYFAKNARPALFTGLGAWQFALLPSSLAPNFQDQSVVQDMCRARPAFATFRVASAFNAVGGNLLRFAIFVSNDAGFADLVSDPSLTIAQSHELNSTGLAAVGSIVQIAVPPLSDFTRANGDGRRYFALGFMAFIGATDWSAGGLDAFLTPHALPTRPFAAPAAY